MKILTELEQLGEKYDEITDSIDFTSDKVSSCIKRQKRKENWGIFSFILQEHWSLAYDLKNTETQFNLLKEYRESISDRISKLKKS